MFQPLSMPALQQLADRLDVCTADAGEQVVTQGDHGDRFYVIEHGTARVLLNGAVRRELVDGDFFGEIALLRDVPRTATVVATTPMQLRSLARDDFLGAVAGPRASRAAAERIVAERLDADARAGDHTASSTPDESLPPAG